MKIPQLSSSKDYPKCQEKSSNEYINGEHSKIVNTQQNNIE